MPKSKAKRPIVSVHAPPSSRGPQPGGEPQQHKQQGKHQHKQHDGALGPARGGVSKRKRPAQEHGSGGGGSGAKRTAHSASARGGQLVCISAVDRQAAQALHTLLQADAGQGKGATLKALTLAPHITAKKATYAVTCEALKHLETLQQVVRRTGLMQRPGMDQLSECSVYVLLYELLIGEGLGHKGPAERLIKTHQADLQAALQHILKEAGAQSVAELLAKRALPAPPEHPRWVRVNTLKMSVADALKHLKAERLAASADALLPDLLRLPPGTSLHAHALVRSGALVLQSKASAMPAHALAPAPGWACVDCCAAPGNKTTHLAALMQGHGRIFAYDKDPRRLERLKGNAELVGAGACILARLQDFLSVDTGSAEMAQVRAVLLDPSCSGSGTVVSRQDHLLPSWRAKQAVLQRVRRRQQAQQAARAAPGGGAKQQQEPDTGQDGDGERDNGAALDEAEEAEIQRAKQLAVFQVAALRHALTFPALERLVYSTCSIHAEENELVVQEVLPEARRLGFELEEALPGWHRRGIPLFAGCEKLVRTDAYEDETDGFFVAVFARRPGHASQQQQQKQAKQGPGREELLDAAPGDGAARGTKAKRRRGGG